ncbi:PREDICTED: melanoma antigen preferentially expressed in tumors-like [Elephantulus edwardii]|uniref:melanoma antigen preferentially expressed in tumors-like n=1 Tax=Elephantulus edwardii TaxID=28737 RepID=UPI0003F0B897|nr:PREDICTED: melanoma antigen preferentially expressed in tumors-like [Elephantulus edwardii]
MTMFNPQCLFDLTKQSLLKNESWVPVASQLIPFLIWEDLFMEAVSGRHMAVVEAMVASWPSPCLDLTSLMRDQQLGALVTLHSVFKALGVLLDQGPRRTAGHLRVLLPAAPVTWLDKELESLRCGKCSRAAPRKPLVGMEVVGDLSFQEADWNLLLSFLTCRVEEGKALPQLYCRKLTFADHLPEYQVIEKILANVQLDGVEELKIYYITKMDFLSMIAPYLSQMVHLKILTLQTLIPRDWILMHPPQDKHRTDQLDTIYKEFTSQLAYLRQFQHLHIIDAYLRGNINHFLKHIETHLESLTISPIYYTLDNSDLKSLSLYPCTRRLKVLNFSKNLLAHLNVKLLGAAILRTSDTLEHLDLSYCDLRDSHLNTILPALIRCSRLRLFKFSGNCVRTSILKRLLRRILPTKKSRCLVLPLPHNSDREDPLVFVSGLVPLLEGLGVLCKIHLNPNEVSFEVRVDVLMEQS